MCKLPCFEGKHCKKHANTLQKTRDLEDFVEKNADNGAKCRLDTFLGVAVVAT